MSAESNKPLLPIVPASPDKPVLVVSPRRLLFITAAAATVLVARNILFPIPPDPHHDALVDRQRQSSLDKCYFGRDTDNELAKRYQPTLDRFANSSLELFARENITICIDPVLEHDNYRGPRQGIVAIYYPKERIIAFDPTYGNSNFDAALLKTPSWANFGVYKNISKQRGESTQSETVPLGNEATEELLTRMPIFRTAPATGSRREGP